ncbi:inhibitor of vertebrate lysozyme family protein [Burkholderia pseudomallei]|nr:inhibitor of vertebrate lysozyme family protein [Burkholderia pseudomallei]
MIRSFFPSSIRRAALAVTIAGIAGAAVAADEPAPTFSEAIAQSAHRAEWKRMISSEKRVPGWLKSDNRVSSPYRREQVEGAPYLVGWMCKPHDCAANQFYGVIDEDSHRMWGMLVTLPQTPGAYDAPSKYASFRWFGKPDERMKTYLQDQLKQDPNWK